MLKRQQIYEDCINDASNNVKRVYNKFAGRFCEAGPIYKDAIPLFYPFIYSEEQIGYIAALTENLMSCIYSLLSLSKENFTELITLLGYFDDEIQLLGGSDFEKDLELSKLFARSDFIIRHNKPYFLETNVSAPLGGIGIADRYYEIFDEIRGEVGLDGTISFNPYINWGEGIKYAINKYTDKNIDETKIILASWDEEIEPDKSDAAEGVYFLKKLGLNVELASFKQLEMREQKIYYMGEVVDVIYGATIFNELQQFPDKKEIFTKIKQYHDQGNVLYLVPMLSNLFGNKGIYALLSDENYNKNIEPEKLDAIINHIPWTRFLKDSNVYYEGKRVDLLQLLKDKKDLFVLKPQLSYSGKGIYIGKNLCMEKWIEVVNQCLFKRYIVQEFIEPDIEELLIKTDRLDGKKPYKNCYGALWFNHHFSGLFIRNMPVSDNDIINISHGSTYSVGFYTLSKNIKF